MNPVQQSHRIYFVGIKGVAMAALAIWAKESGKTVAGSDVGEEFPTDDELTMNAIEVSRGFETNHVALFQPDLVVYTGAHGGKDNGQVHDAIRRGIPVLPHGKALGYAMAGKKQVCVAGSHGKTTTSAMIATILTEAGLDPSYAIGCGSIRGLGYAGHAGTGDWFVAEADEYVTDPGHDMTPRFMWQKPDLLVVTNIDFDHPDVYPDLGAVQNAFVALQKQSASTVINSNDTASEVLNTSDRVAFFGYPRSLGNIRLQIPGAHNLLNADAASVACAKIGIAPSTIRQGLIRFGGTKRRFEKLGEARGALVYDDYAHHPKEIASTIEAFREQYPKKRLIVVFQPHTYSRTKALLSEFARALALTDITLVTEVYASAREKQKEEGLARKLGGIYTPAKADVLQWLENNLNDHDVLVFMGAGDIYLWAKMIL